MNPNVAKGKSLYNSYIDQFKGLKAGPYIQLIKYVISGVVVTFIHVVVFHLFGWKIFPCLSQNDFAVVVSGLTVPEVDVATRAVNSMLSNGIAFLASNLASYLINICWVFESGRHSRFIEIGLFYLVSGVSVLIGTSLMGLLIGYYGMQTTLAFLINIAFTIMVNYSIRKFFIFKG